MSDTEPDEMAGSSAPLIEHLAELRTRLIRSVIALLIAICVFFIPVEGDFIAEHILEFMLRPIEQTLRALGDPSPDAAIYQPAGIPVYVVPDLDGFRLCAGIPGHRLSALGGSLLRGSIVPNNQHFCRFLIASPMMFLLGASFAHLSSHPWQCRFFLGFADVSSIFANLLSGGTPELPDGAAVVPETQDGLRITFSAK